MKEQTRESLIILENNIEVRYVIERYKQENPDISDNIEVKYMVFLPANIIDGSVFLLDELCFDRRLSFMGYYLSCRWGNKTNDEKERYVDKYLIGNKWKEAFDKAESIILSEIEELDKKLKERKKALEDAELE